MAWILILKDIRFIREMMGVKHPLQKRRNIKKKIFTVTK